MQKCGVNLPKAAIESAQRSGCTAGLCLQLVEHFQTKPGAWGPGALQQRIKNARPDQSFEEHWPSPEPEFEQQQIQERRQRDREATRQQRSEAEREKQHRQKQTDALEREFGPKLDAMSEDEVNDLIASHLKTAYSHKMWRRVSPMFRSVLLLELKSRANKSIELAECRQ